MDIIIRAAIAEDVEHIDNFLSPYTAETFYIRSNLIRGGVEYAGKPYQAEYGIACIENAIVGIISHNWIGSVQIFSIMDEAIPLLADFFNKQHRLSKRPVECFLGPQQNVSSLINHLGLNDNDFLGGYRIENLLTLSLDNMKPSDSLLKQDMAIRIAEDSDIQLLSNWRRDFFVEVQHADNNEETYKRAYQEIIRRVHEKNIYLLDKNKKSVSFCGLSGSLKDWTMVGPVWTPIPERSKGYARIITLGSLNLSKQNGCKNAVLFTLNPYAEKAYKAIGFKEVGKWAVVFLRNKYF